MGQKLPNMVADRPITGKCPLCPAVPDFFGKLGVVLLEQLQQGFLLDTDTEIGIFQLGGGDITVRLHQLLIATVYLHPNFIYRKVDSLRFDALARGTAVLHVPQSWGNVHLATELFNLAVHRDTAHQRQVAVRLLAAFLHLPKDANIYASAYQLYLPNKALLQAKVKEWIEEFEESEEEKQINKN